MNKRFLGCCFCVISAILFVLRYLCASIAISGTGNWDTEVFNIILIESGTPIFILSVVFFMIGITYLLLEELKKI